MMTFYLCGLLTGILIGALIVLLVTSWSSSTRPPMIYTIETGETETATSAEPVQPRITESVWIEPVGPVEQLVYEQRRDNQAA